MHTSNLARSHLRLKSLKSLVGIFIALAILCNKNDCVGLIKPWLRLWIKNDNIEFEDYIPGPEPKYEEALFIAWVFGRKKIFQFLATKLVRTMKTNDEGETLTWHGEDLTSQMPPDIIGRFCF